jgi:two-component system, chemotaxis family, protein-glutamate methylesterase/glutaminase
VLAPAEMSLVLTELAGQQVEVSQEGSMEGNLEASELADEIAIEDRHTQPGIPSTMSCPECHGVLWEVKDNELVKFRCRVGHAYTDEALLAHQAGNLEAALWTALRALEEHSALARRLAGRAAGRGHTRSASAFTEQAMDAEHHAAVIRDVLHTGVRSQEIVEAAASATG